MKLFKLIKEIKPVRYIITIIAVFILDSCIADLLFKIGYVQWLGKLIKDTLTIYEDLSFLNYIRVMGMDIVGTMSCFVISYLMFHTFPNIIADVMGYNTEKASTDIKDDTQKLWKE